MDWLPNVERIVTGSTGGSYVGGPFRIVLHRTEGSSIEGAVAAYRAKNVAPHLTVDLRKRRVVQHNPLTSASRALQNLPGGVETNRRSTLQIEIVGFSADSKLDADADVQWFGTAVLRPLMQAFGIQPVYPTFYGPGCGWVLASATARQRMTGAAWNAFNGICAHQHVPEQSHWDSGEFKIGLALAAAGDDDVLKDQKVINPISGTEEDLATTIAYMEQRIVTSILNQLPAAVWNAMIVNPIAGVKETAGTALSYLESRITGRPVKKES